jgi:H/ACA ribonucleoprotein complex subunit 1
MGTFSHVCEDELVYKSTHKKIPKFNSRVYYQDKSEIGMMDEIFGPVNEVVLCSIFL